MTAIQQNLNRILSFRHMDEKDLMILEKLKENARKTVNEIAKEVGLPRTTVGERIKRLMKEGVVKKFTTMLNYEKLGKPVTAFVLISFLPNPKISQRQLAREIARIKNVYEVYIIAGEWDLLLKVRGKDMEEIGQLILDKLRSMKGVGKTVTCTCFSVVKEEL